MTFPTRFLFLSFALLIAAGCGKSPEQLQQKLLSDGIALTPERFIQATQASDTLTLQRMLEAGMDANARTEEGQTAFMTAAQENHVHAMKLLLNHGADPFLKLPDGRGALHLSSARGQMEATRFLLSLKLSADLTDHQGRTPLVEAAANNHVDVMKILLAASTEEKIKSLAPGLSPEVVLSRKEEEPVSSKKMEIPALAAQKTEDSAVISSDSAGVPVVSPVAGAIENGHEDLAIQLLDSGFDFKNSSVQGQPLLAWAIANGHQRFFFKLLEKGADPDTRLKSPASDSFTSKVNNENFHYYLKQDRNVTVLMLASALGETEMVDSLLLKGAKKNIGTAKHETTAIYLAGVNHHAAIVQMLLGKSAKPEDQHYKIEVSLSKQKATIYRDGLAVMNTPISSGRKGFSTPKGTFVITDKYKDWVSTIYDAEMPYFLRLNCGPVGLHAGALPGYPASHGCIRLPYEKAKEFFGTVEVGTIVRIVD